MLKYHIFIILHPTSSFLLSWFIFTFYKKKKVLHKVEKNNLPCCITIPFKAANFVFSSLILAMLTENIERRHTYHELSRHLKGYLLLAYVQKCMSFTYEAYIDTFDIWNDQFIEYECF